MNKTDLDTMFALLLAKFGSWSAIEKEFKLSRQRLRNLQQNGHKVIETLEFIEKAQKALKVAGKRVQE